MTEPCQHTADHSGSIVFFHLHSILIIIIIRVTTERDLIYNNLLYGAR